MLAKQPGTITLKPMHSREQQKGELKRRWKHWIQDTLKKTKDRLEKVQVRYKKKYDAIHEDDYVHLRVERKNPKEHRHKLAPIAEGRYKVTNVDDKTVAIEKTDRSVENVSRSRVLIVTKPQTENEVGTFFNQ